MPLTKNYDPDRYTHLPVGKHRGYEIWRYPPGSKADWGAMSGGVIWFEGTSAEDVKSQIDEAF